MKFIQTLAAPVGLSLALVAGAALAQSGPHAAPANVVQLSASGQVEATQDWLTMRLSTRREGSDANVVQNQLKQALDEALALARAQARPGGMAVRTGQMGLSPRYSREGRVNGWQGVAELVLEGSDLARIGATAGQIQTLAVASVQMGLSPEAQRKLETEAQALAIEAFKRKADEVARGFGFSGYTLREVSISGGQAPAMPYPRMMAMEAKAASADAPVPVEAGKASVNVMVNGAVQLK
jgi:predicted secreted protein